MNPTDERLERYLHDRSTTIDLPHAGVDLIARGARRHRRRRTAACGGVAVALLLGGVAAAGLADTDDDGREQVSGVAAAVVDSPLAWSVVPVTTGLGYGSGAVSDGSAVYSLSTAPGAETPDAYDDPRHLYRSTDGAEWEDVGLPDGLYPSSVSAADGSVYAVGTAAAGGDVGVELAVSGDGGGGWDSRAVPLDLAALADGFPGRVRPVDAEVAVGGGTTVVAVSVAGVVDPAQVLTPEDHPPSWYHRQDGLARIQTGSCATGTDPADPSASTTAPPTTAPETTTTGGPTTVPHDSPGGTATTTAPAGAEPPTTAPAPIGASGAPAGAAPCDPEDEVRTWAELGLTPEQAAVAEGQTHVFAGETGGPLEPVEVFPGAGFADPSTVRLLAADDGWYLVSEAGAVAPLDDPAVGRDVVLEHSADGRTWNPITVAPAQGILSTGVVDGRPVVVAVGSGRVTEAGVEQSVHAHRIEAGGTVTSVDVNRLLDVPSRAGIYTAGVGPLGVAVVMGSGASGEDDRPVVLTSLDGIEWSRTELPEPEAGTRQSVVGTTVTPDAITVRLNLHDEADPDARVPAGQRLFVGTPAG